MKTNDKPGLPVVMYEQGGETIVCMLEPVEYDTSIGKFTVPQMFASDGCSIPRLMWRLVGHPFDAKYLREAILHDWMYKTQPCTRKQADVVFREQLAANGKLGVMKRWMIYRGVRAGGWAAWNKHKKEMEAEK
jgi:uncharacterized protein YcaQ